MVCNYVNLFFIGMNGLVVQQGFPNLQSPIKMFFSFQTFSRSICTSVLSDLHRKLILFLTILGSVLHENTAAECRCQTSTNTKAYNYVNVTSLVPSDHISPTCSYLANFSSMLLPTARTGESKQRQRTVCLCWK